MSKVVSFQANIIPGNPNPDIVMEIERLLDEAKSGDLTGFAYCTIRNDNKGTGWSGNAGTRDSLGAAIMMLHHRYAAGLLGLEE